MVRQGTSIYWLTHLIRQFRHGITIRYHALTGTQRHRQSQVANLFAVGPQQFLSACLERATDTLHVPIGWESLADRHGVY
jgi:hypothetical protein